MKKYVAERRLLYSIKGSDERNDLIVRICAPHAVDDKTMGYPILEGSSVCEVEVEGINEEYSAAYGMDSVQALNIATNLEPFLNRLQKKYDLYWSSGEPYFEE